jgi:hypothetical protein
VPACDSDRGGNVVARRREAHRVGAADRDAGIARVQRELERLGTRTTRTHRGAEIVDEIGLAWVV